MALACEAGLMPAEFWALTPYQTQVAIDAYGKRRGDDERLGITVAWYTEAFARQQRLPKLDKLLRPRKQASKQGLSARLKAVFSTLPKAATTEG